MDNRTLAYCRSRSAEIETMLASRPAEWVTYMPTIKDVIRRIEQSPSPIHRNLVDDYVRLIHVIQQYAYHDSDRAAIGDIASWCKQQWLTILESHPHKVTALAGAAKNWLLQAQPFLARIHRMSRSSSSSESGSSSKILHDYSRSGEDDDDANAIRRAENRLQTADYVEARGILLPSTDLFQKAICAARNQQLVTGDLLVSAAEAFMSLGNVTSIKYNEAYFRQALQYLNEASQIKGYTLEPFLQQYLEEYGRLM